MYKVVVVDDEILAAEVIGKYVDSAADGFQTAGVFDDPDVALKYILENDINLVVADVVMPKMTGLELVKKVNISKPKCKFIMMSGYADFEYVRKSLQYGVFDYILKPVDVENFIEDLSKIKQALDEGNADLIDENEAVGNFFMDLFVSSAANENDIKAMLEENSIAQDFVRKTGELLVVKLLNYEEFIIKNWFYGKDRVLNAFRNILFLLFGYEKVYAVAYSENVIMFIAIKKDGSKEMEEEPIINAYKKYLNIDIKILEKLEFTDIFRIPDIKNIFSIDDTAEVFIKHLMFREKKICYNILNNVVKSTDKDDFLKIVIDKLGIDNVVFDTNEDSIRIIDYLIMKTTSDIDKTSDEIVHRVKIYINSNYYLDISRTDVAKIACLEETYFSRWFKKNFKMNYKEYVTKVRLEKAVELFKGGKSIGEVSFAVGYNNVRYFKKNFVEHFGMTPNEYIRILNDSGDSE